MFLFFAKIAAAFAVAVVVFIFALGALSAIGGPVLVAVVLIGIMVAARIGSRS